MMLNFFSSPTVSIPTVPVSTALPVRLPHYPRSLNQAASYTNVSKPVSTYTDRKTSPVTPHNSPPGIQAACLEFCGCSGVINRVAHETRCCFHETAKRLQKRTN